MAEVLRESTNGSQGEERETQAVTEEAGATDESLAIDQLIELGEEQGQVGVDDILKFFPQAEENIDLLEDVYDALLAAGIPFSGDGLEAREGEDKSEEDAISPVRKRSEREGARATEAIDAGDTIGVYLSQAGRVPLLTREEEVDLSKRIERGREASKELAKGDLSAERRAELQHFVEDGMAAREHLILANLRLVFSVAKKYVGRGVPLMDLVQEGHVGLMRAAKKFDYRRGYKFSTYATWWIRQAITRAVADHGRTIRLPVHMGERISRMHRARHKLTQELGREPNTEELAEAIGESPAKVADMLRFAQRTMSLELPVGDEDDAALGDFIEDEEAPAPEETITRTLLEEHLRDILDTLPPREVRVLQLRYGLWGGKMHTLNEVGEKMGITRERVRQIQAQALRRLRNPARRTELRDYVGG